MIMNSCKSFLGKGLKAKEMRRNGSILINLKIDN